MKQPACIKQYALGQQLKTIKTMTPQKLQQN